MGSTIDVYQQKIDHFIRQLGGYWRPLSGLARLTEEAGELCELFLATNPEKQDIADEVVDLFVISTCLANQYAAVLTEEYTELDMPIEVDRLIPYAQIYQPLRIKNGRHHLQSTPEHILFELMHQAGRVARIINHYEGDKKKKKSESGQRLAQEVARLHARLYKLCAVFEVSLFDHIERIIERNLIRDKGRFALTPDPITESSRTRFLNEIANVESSSFRRVWGLPQWQFDQPLEVNLDNMLPTVQRFHMCCQEEKLDALVLEIDENPLKATDMCDIHHTLANHMEQIGAKCRTIQFDKSYCYFPDCTLQVRAWERFIIIELAGDIE